MRTSASASDNHLSATPTASHPTPSLVAATPQPGRLARLVQTPVNALWGVVTWLSTATDRGVARDGDDDVKITESQGVKRKVPISDASTQTPYGHRDKRIETSQPGPETPGNTGFDDELESLHNMRNALAQRVFGQEGPINVVCDIVCRPPIRTQSSTRRLTSFLFLGPRETGKAELATALAQYLWSGRGRPFMKMDMSNYRAADTVSAFIRTVAGAEEGERPVLAKIKRWGPPSVIVFNKIHEAHADVAKVILGIIKEGVLTDNHGKQVSFENTIVCLNTNSGCDIMDRPDATHPDGSFTSQARADLMHRVEEIVIPELVDAVDERVVFNGLQQRAIADIVHFHTSLVHKKLTTFRCGFSISQNTREWLVMQGSPKLFGPRRIVNMFDEALRLGIRKAISGKRGNFQLLAVKDMPRTCGHNPGSWEGDRCALCPAFDEESVEPSRGVLLHP